MESSLLEEGSKDPDCHLCWSTGKLPHVWMEPHLILRVQCLNTKVLEDLCSLCVRICATITKEVKEAGHGSNLRPDCDDLMTSLETHQFDKLLLKM